jgi:hypothetical protein
MKAKDLAEILMKNPEAIISVYGSNDCWIAAREANFVENEWCDRYDELSKKWKYDSVEKQIQIG